MAFSSSTLVKTHLKISGATYDSLLTQLCGQVDAYITKETGVGTAADAAVTYTNEVIDNDCNTILKAKHHPITEITKIEARQSDNTWLEYTDEVVANIDFSDSRIYPLYLAAPIGQRKVRLTYKAGYATASVPLELQMAAILLVAHLFNTRNNVGFSSLTTLGLNQSMAKEEFLYVTKILTKYKPAYAI